jgi:hypothetical protein
VVQMLGGIKAPGFLMRIINVHAASMAGKPALSIGVFS